jgi:hypothetical protein
VFVLRNRDRGTSQKRGSRIIKLLAVGAIALLAIAFSAAGASANSTLSAPGTRTTFAFISPHIAGAPTGAAALTGFGSYDTAAGTLNANGLFRCTSTVAQGPVSGCMAGQGGHWTSNTLNATQKFVCGTDAVKTATTDGQTVAFKANFFRFGDGSTPSFTPNVIVSTHDIAPDVPGIQRTWIQGVGCGNALQGFAY